MSDTNIDSQMMKVAIEQAKMAMDKNEVPIGAVITFNNTIIAKAFNLTETLCDPTAHAEMQAITAATNALGAKYLKNCTIYVTLEPCPMCAAALKWAQIGRICWAADDVKFGFTTVSNTLIHPKTIVNKGIMSEQASQIIKDFFEKLR